MTSGDGLQVFQDIAAQQLPEGYFVQYAGQSRTEIEAGNTLLIAFGLAVIVIYLVLAATFESFRDPLIIMMAVPLSLFGAMVFLNVGLATINIYTEVGLITLVGLITKHGILMVQFANQQRELRGLEPPRGDRRGGPHPAAPDPDDDLRHGSRRHAAASCRAAPAPRRASRWAW